MTTTARLLTEDDLLRMPRASGRFELIEGELHAMSPTNSDHGATVLNLTGPLWLYVKRLKLGVVFGAETGFTIRKNPDTVLAPDLAFITQARVPAGGLPHKYFPGAPDLAVEVLSPSDTVLEVDEKVSSYLAAGTRLVWIVNSKARTVTVHERDQAARMLTDAQTLGGDPVIPGFTILVREIFA